MAYRGGYGSYYNGRAGGDVDPLAAAIGSFAGGWKESADRRRAAEAQAFEQAQAVEAQNRANEAQRLARAQFDEQKRQAVAEELRRGVERQDRLNEQKRAEEIQKGQSLMDAGFVQMPNLVTGGMTMMRGPSKAEREDASYVRRQTEIAKLLQGQKDEGELRDLRGAAAAVGIKGAETMTVGELRQRVKMADEARENAARMRELGARGAGGASQVRVTEGERTGAALYDFAKPAYDRLTQRFKSDPDGVSFMDKLGESLKGDWRPDALGNVLQSDEGQQTFDDLAAIVLASQYAMSGKAVTEGEARKLARSLVPQIGDKPGRRQQKMQEITTRLRVVERSAGRALANPNAPVVPQSAMDALDLIGR